MVAASREQGSAVPRGAVPPAMLLFGLGMAAAAPVLVRALAGGGAVAGVQLAIAAGVLARLALPPGTALAAAGAAGLAGLALCRASPLAGAALTAGLAHAAIYGGLLVIFARSLRPGAEPVATRLARRIHAPLTPARAAYTRGVTWTWTGYFAVQLAASLPLAVWLGTAGAASGWPWLIGTADLPLAALLFAGELVVRSRRFRGQPHATASDMLRALARPGATETVRDPR